MKLFNAMFSKVNGGLEQVFLAYTPALTLQGNQVISVIHPQAQIRTHCSRENLITIHNFNQHDFLAIYRLRQLVLKEKPACIITHSYRAAYLFKKTKTKVPKIAVCHVKGHYDFGSDAIIAITESMRQEIIQSGHQEHTVFTVPNMIDIPLGLTYKEPKANNIPVIGVCARFADIKGVDIFIEALAELKRRKVPFKAKIAGDGPQKDRYIQMINALDLSNEVTLIGWINDKEAFYQSIDIFCLPSREEAFGLVILEAMTHSLPMVLSKLSGPIDIVADSNCAILVPPCNPKSMAEGLARIINDHSLAKELSLNAFNRVHYYSYENVGPLLQSVVRTVCDNYR